MGFAEAVQSGFNNYVNFSGRASRPAYWYWVLFEVLVVIGFTIVGNALRAPILGNLASLALLLPSIAVGVRRLHDIGKSGWNLLWALIPILGGLYLLYLAVQPSQPGDNAYGPGPA